MRLQMLHDCWLFILLFALPVSLWKSPHFCSRLPFRIFPLESFFLFSFLFCFDCPIMHLKIHPGQVNGLSRILAEDRRQQPSLITKKNSQGKSSSVQVSTFDQNGLFRYVIQARVHGFERKDNRPKLYFRVIWPKIIFSLSVYSSLFSYLFLWFSNSLSFSLAHFYFQWGELNISWNPNFSDLPSSIRHLTHL